MLCFSVYGHEDTRSLWLWCWLELTIGTHPTFGFSSCQLAHSWPKEAEIAGSLFTAAVRQSWVGIPGPKRWTVPTWPKGHDSRLQSTTPMWMPSLHFRATHGKGLRQLSSYPADFPSIGMLFAPIILKGKSLIGSSSGNQARDFWEFRRREVGSIANRYYSVFGYVIQNIKTTIEWRLAQFLTSLGF